MLVFEASLKKPPGRRLGVELALAQPGSARGRCLVVESISEGGVVDAWNRTNRPKRIQKGDIITRVNGAEDISALASELRAADVLRVTIQRDEGEAARGTWQDPTGMAMMSRPAGPGIVGIGGYDRAGQVPTPHFPQVHMQHSAAMSHDRAQQQQQAQWMQQQQIRQARLQGQAPMPHPSHLAPHPASSVQAGGRGSLGSAELPPGGKPRDEGESEFGFESEFIFEADLRKAEDSRLGIDVLPVTISEFQGLNVLNVAEGGAVDLWNQQQVWSQMCIRSGDALMSVNNIESDIDGMMEELRTQRRLHLLVLRRSNAGGAPPPVSAAGHVAGKGIAPPPHQMGGGKGPGPCGQWAGHFGQGTSPANVDIDDYFHARGPLGKGFPAFDAGYGPLVPRDIPATTLGGASALAGFEGVLQRSSDARLRMAQESSEAAAAARGLPGLEVAAPPGPVGAGGSQSGPFVFEAILPKNENSRLGIDVLPVAIGEYGGLSVLKVSSNGIVARWNAEQTSALRICPGDALMSVNDVRGTDIKRMMEALGVPQELRLLVLRRPSGTLVPPTPGAPLAPCGGALTAGRGAGVPPGPPALPPAQPPQHLPHFAGDRDAAEHHSGSAPMLPPPPSFSTVSLGAGAVAPAAAPEEGARRSPPEPQSITGSPIRFEVVIDRSPGLPLGLDVIVVQGGSPAMGLLAERIADGGPIDLWNKRNEMPHRVLPGDRILQVNQVQAWEPPAERAKEFKKDHGQTRFWVQRGLVAAALPPPPPPPPLPPPPPEIPALVEEASEERPAVAVNGGPEEVAEEAEEGGGIEARPEEPEDPQDASAASMVPASRLGKRPPPPAPSALQAPVDDPPMTTMMQPPTKPPAGLPPAPPPKGPPPQPPPQPPPSPPEQKEQEEEEETDENEEKEEEAEAEVMEEGQAEEVKEQPDQEDVEVPTGGENAGGEEAERVGVSEPSPMARRPTSDPSLSPPPEAPPPPPPNRPSS